MNIDEMSADDRRALEEESDRMNLLFYETLRAEIYNMLKPFIQKALDDKYDPVYLIYHISTIANWITNAEYAERSAR